MYALRGGDHNRVHCEAFQKDVRAKGGLPPMYMEREPWKIRKEYDTRFLFRLKDVRERENYLKTVEEYNRQNAANNPAPGTKRPLDEAPVGPDQPAKVRAGGSSPSYAAAVSTPLGSSHSPLMAGKVGGGPFLVGVVAGDGKTGISSEAFVELVDTLSDAFEALVDKGETAPTVTTIFPAGLEKAGVEFRGWELADKVSLEIVDKMVKESTGQRFQVLTTAEIKKNRREILFQASLGRVGDKNSLLVRKSDEWLKKSVETSKSLHGSGGRLEFVRTLESEGTKYLVIQLDEAGLASLRQNQYRLQLGFHGILSFDTHRPPAPQSSEGSSGRRDRNNQPVSAVDELAGAAAAMALRSPSPAAQPMEQDATKTTNPPTITVEGIQPLSNQGLASAPAGEDRVSDKGGESDFDGVEIGGEEAEELGGSTEESESQGNRGNPGNHGNQPGPS